MTHITLIRHGQANTHATTAEDYDRLSELGQQQAAWLGQYLHETQAQFAELEYDDRPVGLQNLLLAAMVVPHVVCCLLLARRSTGEGWCSLLLWGWAACPFAAVAMVAFELHARYGDPPRLCVNTMDPGTVNTKMLLAGWGRCGIPVHQATRSYDMLTKPEWGTKSGECAAASPDRECADAALRRRLWDDLTALTGAEYPAK